MIHQKAILRQIYVVAGRASKLQLIMLYGTECKDSVIMSGALKYSQVYTHVGTIFISQSITKLDQNQNRVHRRHVSPKTRMKTARCGGGAAVEFTARREKWRGNQNQQPRTDVWCPPPVFLPKYLPRVRMTCAVGLFIRPCTETSMAPKCGELARMLRDSAIKLTF
jgi:hypothetical protein